MSETVCIHGIPIDPWYIYCDLCQRMPDEPATYPLPKHQTADVEGLLASVAEEERLQEDLPEEDGDG